MEEEERSEWVSRRERVGRLERIQVYSFPRLK